MGRQSILFLAAVTLLSAAIPAPLIAQRQQADPSIEIAALSKQRAELAREWLQSSDPLHIAWGAAIARQETLNNLAPLLVAQLEGYSATATTGVDVAPVDLDRHDAMLAVLDTLISLEAQLPVETAKRLYLEFRAPALILLVRSYDAKRFPALLEIFQDARPLEDWLAAGNVLVQTAQPGFAAAVLANFTKHLKVMVTDSRSGIGGGIGSAGCGDGGEGSKPGWPAIGIYQLEHSSGRYAAQMTVLADGDEPVFFRRHESHWYHSISHCDFGDHNEFRSQYLAKLTRFSGGPNNDAKVTAYESITWHGPDDYKEKLLTAIVGQRNAFRRIVSELVADHRLTMDEVLSLKPRVEIKISDMRHDKSVPLPDLLLQDENTKIVTQFSSGR